MNHSVFRTLSSAIFSVLGLMALLVLLPAMATAGITREDEIALRKVVKVFEGSRNVAALLRRIHGQIPEADFQFLKEKLKPYASSELPKVSVRSQDLVAFQGDKTIAMQIISTAKQQFQFAGKSVDLAGALTPEDRWNVFARALPSGKAGDFEASVLYRLAFPQAKAIPLAPIAWGIYIAGGMVIGLYLSNESQCKDIALQLDKCTKQKHRLAQFIDSHVAVAALADKEKKKKKKKKDDDDENEEVTKWRELQEARKKGQCPLNTISEELDSDTADMFSESLREMNTTPATWAICLDGRRDAALACVDEVVKIAKDLCLGISLKMFDSIKATPGIQSAPSRTQTLTPATKSTQ